MIGRAHLAASLGMLRRDLSVLLSYRLTLVTQVLSTLLTLTIFFYISRLVTVGDFQTHDEYFAYAVIGIIALDVVIATVALLPTVVRQELVAGTFERLVVSPFGAVGSVISMALFQMLFSVARGAVMVLFAVLLFGLDIRGPEALFALPIGIIAALSFLPFGLLVAAAVLIVKQVMGAGNWIVAGISIVAGFYFPIALLPGWIQWMSDVQPFTPAVESLRFLIVGTPMDDPLWSALAQLTLFAAVLLPASVWVLQRAVQAGRRRGTIIEY